MAVFVRSSVNGGQILSIQWAQTTAGKAFVEATQFDDLLVYSNRALGVICVADPFHLVERLSAVMGLDNYLHDTGFVILQRPGGDLSKN